MYLDRALPKDGKVGGEWGLEVRPEVGRDVIRGLASKDRPRSLVDVHQKLASAVASMRILRKRHSYVDFRDLMLVCNRPVTCAGIWSRSWRIQYAKRLESRGRDPG